ncbi:hypothetical protein TNCV_4892981 [Trichonephila clavipes]|nr:hypothetical protein TNCV_4892981 [Trichonephila clavipes]
MYEKRIWHLRFLLDEVENSEKEIDQETKDPDEIMNINSDSEMLASLGSQVEAYEIPSLPKLSSIGKIINGDDPSIHYRYCNELIRNQMARQHKVDLDLLKNHFPQASLLPAGVFSNS